MNTQKALALSLLFLFCGGSSGEPLQKQAHSQYVNREFRKAAGTNIAILADSASSVHHRRYATQMLGTIYENHLCNFDSALIWYRRFADRYARGGQKAFYKKKIAFLEGLGEQEKKGYAIIQKAIYATQDSLEQIALLEEGLAAAPELSNRTDILTLLSHKAFGAGLYAKARAAMLELRRSDPQLIKGDMLYRFEMVQSLWMKSIIARVFWVIAVLLMLAVLPTVRYGKLSGKAWKTLGILCGAAALLGTVGSVVYLAKIHALVHNPFPKSSIFIAALLLLAITVWTFCARFSIIGRISGRASIVVLPLLSLLLALMVSFLFCYHQRKRVKIFTEFGDRYEHWFTGTPEGSNHEEQ